MTELGLVGGFVTFRLGDREFAAELAGVREVLRLEGLLALPGMVAPMAGVIEVRGVPLPVMDVRPIAGSPGDVLVLTDGLADSNAIGIAVDGVSAVRGPDELLHSADGELPAGLPSYVIEVLREASSAKPVLLVDLRRMLDLVTV
jgi:chemotaxis signal transduction protein